MSDQYDSNAKSVSDPATKHWQIAPSDTTDLSPRPRAIFCKVAGTAVIRDEAGTDLAYPLNAGDIVPFRGVRMLATGTTGTYYGWF